MPAMKGDTRFGTWSFLLLGGVTTVLKRAYGGRLINIQVLDPRFLLGLIGAVLLLQTPVMAQECTPAREAYGSVTGFLVDARTYEYTEAQFSELDAEILDRAAEISPHFVLIEDGTRTVHPFFGGGSFFGPEVARDSINEEGVAPYAGHRVKVTGCISNADWNPDITNISHLEILD